MAMLTLRKIKGNLGFTDGDQVKISRKSVKATVAVTGFTVKHDFLLKLLFKWLSRGLPIVTDVKSGLA
jgi:farnesyl-diphosphate farnesyltransferase